MYTSDPLEPTVLAVGSRNQVLPCFVLSSSSPPAPGPLPIQQGTTVGALPRAKARVGQVIAVHF